MWKDSNIKQLKMFSGWWYLPLVHSVLQRELEKVKKRRIVSIVPYKLCVLILLVESCDCTQVPQNNLHGNESWHSVLQDC